MQIREVFDRKRFVFLDGGMGTQLQARGLQPGQKPELAALEMPEVLTAIHTDYANAGADILLANTFGANAKKLTGCGHTVEEVVSASIACARKAAETTGACVALDIGPLGELLVPAGTLAFEDAYNEFAQVIRAGAAAGADLVFLETMTDLYELKAATLCCAELPPVTCFFCNRLEPSVQYVYCSTQGGFVISSPECTELNYSSFLFPRNKES